jgi:hypothetical protein
MHIDFDAALPQVSLQIIYQVSSRRDIAALRRSPALLLGR